MPSKDTFHRDNPKFNERLIQEGSLSSGPERQSATSATGRGTTGSSTARREMSAQVERLARRSGSDPDELAKKIPADTLRRTKYPVIEQVDENGRRTFKHDTGIQDDGLISSLKR